MSFIYEKGTQEEVEEFNLDELWNYYHLNEFNLTKSMEQWR